ncbi:hypothetical protein KKC13_09900 [bacterium]|nr:hypothetical protein [bacterium]MBU1956957.1 hypothetical protein [bacterium]
MRIFIFIALLTIYVFSDNKFSDIKIVFINGIQNTNTEAEKGAKQLSYALDSSGRTKIQTIYNHTDGKNGYGFLGDVLETYRLAKYDGTNGGKDFTPFWKAISGMNSVVTNNKKFQDDYLENIVDNFYDSYSDISDVYARIAWERGKSENKKLLILSHSEGTVAANIVMKGLIDNFSDSQVKECTRLVSIATPVSTAVGIRNNGLYTTSDNDIVIGAIRPDVGSMPNNIHTEFDSKNDFLGHGLVEIYLNRGATPHPRYIDELEYHRPHHETRAKIISDINLMADEINEKCQPCTEEENQVMEDVTWLKKYVNNNRLVNIADLTTAFLNQEKRVFIFSYDKYIYPNSWKIERDPGSNYIDKRYIGATIDYFNKNIYGLVIKPPPVEEQYTAKARWRETTLSRNHGDTFYMVLDVSVYKNNNLDHTETLNLLQLGWYDGRVHFRDSSKHHYDVWCKGSRDMCTYVKNYIRVDDDAYSNTPYSDWNIDWTVFDYGAYENEVSLFLYNIRKRVEYYYARGNNPPSLTHYPSDWLPKFRSWIENVDVEKCTTVQVDKVYNKVHEHSIYKVKGL